MKINAGVGDEAILAEFGHRLARHRIERGITQAELATEAGLSKRTVERLEAGGSTQFASVLRVARVLGLLDGFDVAIPAPAASPLALLDNEGKQRRRVGRRRERRDDVPWSWGDDA